MLALWKLPARLCRWRRSTDASSDRRLPEEIAAGSLEEMVRQAVEMRGDVLDRQLFFIDGEQMEPLTWRAITELRELPSFPVDI